MPQMAPLQWLNLMIMFSSLIMLMNSMIFFYKNYNLNYNNKKNKTFKNWKW